MAVSLLAVSLLSISLISTLLAIGLLPVALAVPLLVAGLLVTTTASIPAVCAATAAGVSLVEYLFSWLALYINSSGSGHIFSLQSPIRILYAIKLYRFTDRQTPKPVFLNFSLVHKIISSVCAFYEAVSFHPFSALSRHSR